MRCQTANFVVSAAPYKVEPHMLLRESEAEDFANCHTDLITEEIVQMAEIFGVGKEKMLCSVLIFRIDLETMDQEKFQLNWHKEGRFKRKLEKAIMVYSLESFRDRLDAIQKASKIRC